MTDDTIARIDALLRSSALSAAEKEQLLGLVGALRTELKALPQERAEKGASVAAFTEVATREAVRKDKDPEMLNYATGGIGKALGNLGKDHPALTRVVNQICDFLSGTGI